MAILLAKLFSSVRICTMKKSIKEPKILSLILGGGKGTRLFPLTKERSKPAVSFGGKYRIVDVPISNCINSGLKKIYLLTQFNSASLHLHIANAYNFDRFSSGFVEILAAEQTLEHTGWYEGTADCVRKGLVHCRPQKPTHYMILSGDQLYKMDLRAFFDEHVKAKADISVATTAVTREAASGFGIMKVGEAGQIVDFMEKPNKDLDITSWKIPAEARGSLPADREYLASMGIYLFNAEALEAALDNDFKDFGKEVIPQAIKKVNVHSYIFDGYWEDIGTIKSFYDANIQLTSERPDFDFFSEDTPIYTQLKNLPPSKINKAQMTATLTSEGCVITDCTMNQSIIGLRSIIKKGTMLDGVIHMGSDYYETDEEREQNKAKGIPDIGIGENCQIKRAIIDKNARIGNNVRINMDGNTYPNGDNKSFYSSDGIIVIRKGATVADNTVI